MSAHQVDLDAYHKQREALIQSDRALRRDYERAAKYTDAERKADSVVRAIRAAEASSIWGVDHESIPHPFPGMEFLTGRSIIVKSQLFKLLTKMPKGALLHAHLDATVNPSILLNLALQQPSMHVRVPAALTSKNISSVLPEFSPLPTVQFTEHASITAASYQPDSWVGLNKARDSFDPALGGPHGFDKWFVGALSINPSQAYETHKTVKKIWTKFSSIFRIAAGLFRLKPIFRAYVREFIMSSIADGISYIEARIGFLFKYMFGEDGLENIPHREWLVIIDQVIAEVKDEMKREGREDEFFGMRIIYSTIRFITPEEMEWYLEDCIALKKEFPHLIAGMDIVGSETTLQPIIYYIEPFLRFRARVQELGLDLPFILHAGETLGDGTHCDMNLYDAILLGTKRIGHGFSLVKHPKLMEICRERDILLEVCPISNEILRLTSSMEMHPLPILLNHGVPVALCSDDPAVFGNMGLSFDFFQVLAASEVTGLLQLGEMARDGINYSTLSAEEKARALQLWERRWSKFVDEIAQLEFKVLS